MNLTPQTLLQSRYEILETVEQDATGARYLGLDLRLGREVSIRTFPLPLPQANEDYRTMDARTSLVVAVHHPGIELFLDMGFHQRLAFVVSEWAPTHLGLLLAQAPTDSPRALSIVRGILAALAAAHGAGVPHGRLCPSAVLVNPEGEIRLRDFSLSPTDRLPPGSPYVAPEGPEPSAAADLYACGVLLRDMMGAGQPGEAQPMLAGLLDPDPRKRLAFTRSLDLAVPSQALAPARRWLPRRTGLAVVGLGVLGLAGWTALAWLRPSPQTTDNPEAVAAYRRARFSLARRTPLDLKKAENGFLECLGLAPKDPRASAGLAVTYALQGVHAVLPPRAAEEKAREAAMAALALQPKSAEATAVLAYLAFRYEWDWTRADALFRKAVRQDPADPLVRHWYGFYLSAAGRHREAIAELKEGARLDPVDLQILTNLGVAEAWSGDVETGLATLRRVVDLDPRFNSAWDRLARILESQGRIPEAVATYRTMAKLGYVGPALLAEIEKAAAAGQPEAYFRERLRMSRDARLSVATYSALLGDRDRAFQAIDSLVRERDLFVVWIPGDNAFSGLHTDPRFAAFLRQIRYPAA